MNSTNPSSYQSIRLKMKYGFCAAILSIFALGVVQIYSNWHENFKDIRLEMSHNAQIARLLVDDALIDGSKFLDITKDDLVSEGLISSKNNLAIDNSLRKSIAKFKVSSWFHTYGNMLFVNSSGDVMAQSDGPLTRKINVSDRFYFNSLKEDSGQSLIVGPEVTARSNGKKVFHLATPLVDEHRDFQGVLVIQVKAEKFKEDLSEVLVDGYENLGLYLSGGQLVMALSDHVQGPISEGIVQKINSDQKANDVFNIQPDNFLGYTTIIAYSEIPNLGLYIIGSSSSKFIWLRTLFWSMKFLLLIGLSCLLVGYFAYRLLDSINKAESENHSAIHDPLTHLPNRRYFDELFPKIQGDCRRTHSPLSILFIDIDKFKNFNDLYGHECGDKVLKVIAKTILSLRKRPLDFFCRWGGEEFLFILPDTNQEGAIHYAQEVLEAVRSQDIELNDGIVVHVSVSVGVATDIDGTHNISDDLIKQADSAMYLAKQSGRDRCATYQEGMSRKAS
ncbi:diguanylate cyclase [Polynucleobacter sp. UK-Gri1-W3]|uniref:sensor domain-containing diguanylate cyclase n=1 Tax=Polynucleobacter sp. UK-Gri1-W3 TaxID=1819737 RepID=UPI001C0D6AC0|nr:diguanylate cyclase [Polynucleobacter sp. UK-Gri1-W3]MBU3538679.1 diguanylate cyclase [Polynucleobacter sp. UK-Gri1-W3]